MTLQSRTSIVWEYASAPDRTATAARRDGHDARVDERTHDDLVKLRAAGFDAFLVGTHLMLSPDPAAALSSLLISARGTL